MALRLYILRDDTVRNKRSPPFFLSNTLKKPLLTPKNPFLSQIIDAKCSQFPPFEPYDDDAIVNNLLKDSLPS
jgi:hypothetical protein